MKKTKKMCRKTLKSRYEVYVYSIHAYFNIDLKINKPKNYFNYIVVWFTYSCCMAGVICT